MRPCDSCVFVQVLGSGCAESQQERLNKDLTVGPVRFFAYVLNAKLWLDGTVVFTFGGQSGGCSRFLGSGLLVVRV